MKFQQIQLLITDKQTTTKLANCIKVKMAEFQTKKEKQLFNKVKMAVNKQQH